MKKRRENPRKKVEGGFPGKPKSLSKGARREENQIRGWASLKGRVGKGEKGKIRKKEMEKQNRKRMRE